MSNPDTAQAAAAVTADILGEFVTKHGDENAARMLHELEGTATPDVAPAAQPVSIPATAAAAAPAPVTATPRVDHDPEPEPTDDPDDLFALPSFDPVPDDELDRLLEEPDFDEEAAAEVQAAVDAGEYDETVDLDAAAKIRAQEKRIQFLEQQIVKKSRKGWVEENLRKYPLLATYARDEVEKIDATSRRAFAREAAKLHDRFSAVAKPLLDDLAKAKAQIKTDATTEARQEVQAAWGKPAVDPAAPAAQAALSELQEARKRRAPAAERFKLLDKVLSGGR